MRLTVVSIGYVGAVHAACMAEIGHEVLGLDVDEELIAALAAGHPPFYEPGLSRMLQRAVTTGRLRFTTSPAEAARFADTHFVCVGTPQRPGSGAADLRHVEGAVDALAPGLRRAGHNGALVIGKSTLPVGTPDRLAERLRAAGADADVAWNPEFLREGCAIQDTLRPERMVAGVRSERAEAQMRAVYAPLLAAGTPFIATAELVKVSSNSFLATKISFINAMPDICDVTGADAHPGRGGGRRLPYRAPFPGPRSRLRRQPPGQGHPGLRRGRRESAGAIRWHSSARSARSTHGSAGASSTSRSGSSVADRSVAVLGAAFKPGSGDVRDSPALAVAEEVRCRGAQVRVHDPEAVDNARAAHPALQYPLDVTKACEQADVVLHLTEWPQYQELDHAALATVVRNPAMVEARNTFDAQAWHSAGRRLCAPGRPRLG